MKFTVGIELLNYFYLILDISFSMPLKKMNVSGTDGNNLSSATDSVAKEETDDDEEEEEEDDEWINDIGLHSNLRSKL